MKNIALIYSPKGGSVEHVAGRFKELCNFDIPIFSISDFEIKNLSHYDAIILGCSTVGADSWDDASQSNNWDSFFTSIDDGGISISNKNFAIFGLGNQILYPKHFVDAIYDIKKQLDKRGAKVIGECSPEGYEDFTDSRSLINGKFLGLPIDEDNEPEKTDDRINAWLSVIHDQF